MIFDWKQFITNALIQSVIFWGIVAFGGSGIFAMLVSVVIPIAFLKSPWEPKDEDK